jgi:hypothetical protein
MVGFPCSEGVLLEASDEFGVCPISQPRPNPWDVAAKNRQDAGRENSATRLSPLVGEMADRPEGEFLSPRRSGGHRQLTPTHEVFP